MRCFKAECRRDISPGEVYYEYRGHTMCGKCRLEMLQAKTRELQEMIKTNAENLMTLNNEIKEILCHSKARTA